MAVNIENEDDTRRRTTTPLNNDTNAANIANPNNNNHGHVGMPASRQTHNLSHFINFNSIDPTTAHNGHNGHHPAAHHHNQQHLPAPQHTHAQRGGHHMAVPPMPTYVRPVDRLHHLVSEFHTELDILLAALRDHPAFPDSSVNAWKEDTLNRLMVEVVPALGVATQKVANVVRDGMVENRGGIRVYSGGI